MLVGDFMCGGHLKARESRTRVQVTYIASEVGPGGMSCAHVPLTVELSKPLGARPIVDGVTHGTVPVWRWTAPVEVCEHARIRNTGSATFSTVNAVHAFAVSHGQKYAFPARPAKAPAVWCWQSLPSGSCANGRCIPPPQWRAIGVAPDRWRLTTDVIVAGGQPPTTAPR